MSIEVSRHSEQRFRTLIERGSNAIALLTPEGIITYASPSTERVTGYTAGELVGMNGFELLHPEDLEDVRQQFAALLDQPGEFITVECRLRHPDGTWRWMEGTLTNLLDEPAVEAIMCNYRDVTRRKGVHERLRQSEERYRVLVEQASVGIFVTDLQGRFVEVNPVGCTLSGISRDELLTKGIEDLVSVEDRAAASAGVERLRAGETTCAQLHIQRKDGSLLPAELNTTLLSTGHLLWIVHNISARIQAEARASELEAIFEAMTEGVTVCDVKGEIRYTNAAYRSLMAFEDADPSLLLLDKRFEWLAARDLEGRPLPKEQLAVLRLLRGERLSGEYAMDFICRTCKGADIIVNVSGAPIRDAAGQIAGGVVVFRDVTERHKLEQQLQYSERKLRSLVESNIFGMIVTDPAGRIYEANDRFAQMVGYSKDDLLSGAVTWRQLVPPDSQEMQAQIDLTLLSTGVIPPWEKEYLLKDGSRVPVLVAGAMIDQERDHTLVVVLDISERKAAERRKQEFLSMVSHELRTPLTSIMGLIDLALMQIELHLRSLAPEAEGLLVQIEKMLKRASGQVEIEARLVEELLEMSRLEMHKFELFMQQENLVTIVQETVAHQQQAARTRQVELALPSDEVVPVLVDAGRIGQVLTNYLTNAFKYAPVEQAVSVRLEVAGSIVRVSVRDQGPGLTPDQQQRVWDRFYQVGAPGHQGPEGGLGLGLAIARAIVEQLHGQVGVESAPGQGSTFWFTLPLIE